MSLGQHITGPLTYIITKSRKRDNVDTIFKVIFLALQLTDLALTLVAARSGYPELNPMLRGSVDSVTTLAILKCCIPVAISWFVPGRWLLPAILLLFGVVGWNVTEMIMLTF